MGSNQSTLSNFGFFSELLNPIIQQTNPPYSYLFFFFSFFPEPTRHKPALKKKNPPVSQPHYFCKPDRKSYMIDSHRNEQRAHTPSIHVLHSHDCTLQARTRELDSVCDRGAARLKLCV